VNRAALRCAGLLSPRALDQTWGQLVIWTFRIVKLSHCPRPFVDANLACKGKRTGQQI
jgi:hypothetical protein